MVEHLEKDDKLIYVLNVLPTAADAGYARNLTAIGVLKQLVIQSLQQVPWLQMTDPVSLIASVTSRIKQASTQEDCIDILHETLGLTRSFKIVVDLGILGARWQEAQSWPKVFKDLLARLNGNIKYAEKPRIMFLTCHKFPLPSDSCCVVPIRKIPSSGFSSRRIIVHKQNSNDRGGTIGSSADSSFNTLPIRDVSMGSSSTSDSTNGESLKRYGILIRRQLLNLIYLLNGWIEAPRSKILRELTEKMPDKCWKTQTRMYYKTIRLLWTRLITSHLLNQKRETSLKWRYYVLSLGKLMQWRLLSMSIGTQIN
jgi:hypothetical protein